MTMTVEQPRALQWSRRLYERAVTLGLFEGRRVELVGGEIIERAAKGPVHARANNRARKELERAFPADRFIVRPQDPLSLGEWDAPEPDLAVAVGTDDDYGAAHPTAEQVVLVVEVSDTTLEYDLGGKGDLYAAADLRDYWVVAPALGCVFVMRGREPEAASRTQWRYGQRRQYRRVDCPVRTSGGSGRGR